MRLVTFADNTGERIGVFIPEIEKVIDLVAADPSLPRDMNAFIDLRSEGLEKAATACQTASEYAQIDAEAQCVLCRQELP